MFLFSQGLLKNNRIEKHIFCFAKRIFRPRRGRNTKRTETFAFATQNIDYQKQPARVVYGVDPTGGLF